MAGFFEVVKHLFLPGIIAAAIYVLLAYVLLPLYRSHRERYAHYLPIDTISSRTATLRDRVTTGFTNYILHRAGSTRDIVVGRVYVDNNSSGGSRRGSGASGDELYLGEEEGETMVGFDMGRRERLRHSERNSHVGSERRLSRDLEEGFRDDSGSDEDSRDERRR